MGTTIKDHAKSPKLVFQLLEQHIPYSLPTWRRIQFLDNPAHPGGYRTPHSHILSTFDTEAPGTDFLVAYLDFSRGPETEMWLYSSLENPHIAADETVCEAQVLQLLTRVGEIARAYEGALANPGALLIGSLHKRVFQFLKKQSLVGFESPEHTKFLFRVEDLPLGRGLPDGLSWSAIRPADIPLVLSRTSIPYTAHLMKLNPSASIESSTGPVAWGFLGPDGSLKVLHCEEAYRGRGLAKAVALKLFRDHTRDLVKDGLYQADVGVFNQQSQGLCRSLVGSAEWSVYWTVVSFPTKTVN